MKTETGIDVTIQGLEQLYESVTGRQPPRPGSPSSAMSLPEEGALAHIDERLDALLAMLGAAAPAGAQATHEPVWTPRMTVRTDADGCHFYFELGGVRRDQMTLVLAGESLVLEGRRAAPWSQGSGGNTYATEVAYGPFRRRVALPAGVASDGVRAEMRDGMLHVIVPTAAPAGSDARQLTID